MEFQDLQKVWDAQNNRPLYAFDESALHNTIISKMKQGKHISNASELITIIVNVGAGIFIAMINLFKTSSNISMYLLALWMIGISLYALISRIKRIRNNRRFDRSMQGDLDNALDVATYQVRFSRLMRWNILPVAVFTILGMLESGKSLWLALGISLFLLLANYFAGWEHSIYKNRKKSLEILKAKLESEDPQALASA